MIRIMVVDDHPVVRKGLAAVLEDEADLEVVAAAGSAEKMLALARELRPDVILLDLKLAGMSGVDAIAELTGAQAGTRVVVFTAFDSDENIGGALRNGAKGYVLKGAPASQIAQAIRQVHAGGSYLAPEVAAKIAAKTVSLQAVPVLTQRQREVLRLVGAGASNKKIAGTLGITERTAKFHLRSIMNRLGADNRAQAVALAARRKLL
ncbi:MAG: response regulator transcription factor [Candidatus Eremiobacteraeota bacterium]|nr:response regulator transcription factor [Candidatus Eremiobacteraeota bacterium]MBC5827756.1 response regulator transcription factor [Candidatus Eremiobacteraeota bacterium]